MIWFKSTLHLFVALVLVSVCCACSEESEQSDALSESDSQILDIAFDGAVLSDLGIADTMVEDSSMDSDLNDVDLSLQAGELAVNDAEVPSADSSTPAPSCGTEACGGDLVGTWSLNGICEGGYTSYEDVLVSCDVPATQTVAINASGSVEFYQDGTYESLTVLAINFALSVPGRCAIGIASCAIIEYNFQNSEETQDWTCNQLSNSDPCVCSGQRTETESVVGTYSVEGQGLNITPLETMSDSPNRSAELKGQFDYCAESETLRLIRPADEDIPSVLTLVYERSEMDAPTSP
jgi:hypothetical protein